MIKRPRSITYLSWLFIIVGILSLIGGFLELTDAHITQGFTEISLAAIIRILAIVSGVFMLKGFNWARWLLVVWLIFHVIYSFSHSIYEVLIHCLLLILVSYFLFRKDANIFFKSKKTIHPKLN